MNDYQQVRAKQIAFHSSCSGSLVLCLVIHLMSPMYVSSDLLRLCMVILFFGCLATAAWSLTTPYTDYQSALVRWRYADAAPSIRHTADRMARRKSTLFHGLGVLGTAAVTLIGLGVLSQWTLFKGVIGSLQALFFYAGLGALLMIPVYIALKGRKFREVYALQNQVDEEMAISGASLRSAQQHNQQHGRTNDAPVVVTGKQTFRAGEYDWYWSDFYKNTAIFGQSGSGKTICVLNAILDGLISSAGSGEKAASGLILDPKGDYREKIQTLCRQNGREADLLIIDPGKLSATVKWNPLDSTDDALEIAGRFGAVMETISPSGGDDKFWIESSVRLVQNLISLMRHVNPTAPPSLVAIHDAAMSDKILDEWAHQVTWEVLESSREATRTLDYLVDVWNAMPTDTKGTIRAFVSNMLGSFLMEPYDELFAGESDYTISEIVDSGKILYVYMPIADKEVMSKVVSTFIKLEFYREVLKRPDKKRPSFFLCDEFQSFFTVGQGRGDADAFARTRQSSHANIIAFQNLNALLKETDRKEAVMNLLGNCATKLFLRNTDVETNEFASAMFGEQIETLSSTSIGIGEGAAGRGGSSSVSGSAQYTARIKKDAFNTLAVPSIEDGVVHAETIAHLASRSSVSAQKLRWKVHPITSGSSS